MNAWCVHKIVRLAYLLVGAVLALMCMLSPASVLAQGNEPDGTLVVASGQRVAQSIATTDRDIRVEGEVMGDVTTWSGDISILGHVTGDVVSYSGDVKLDSRARVDGNVLTVAGAVDSAGDQVAGALINGTMGGNAVSAVLNVVTPSRQSQDASDNALLRSAASGVTLLVLLGLATLSALLWPRRTVGASRTFALAPWRSLALGTLSTLLFGALLLLAGTLVALTLVGLPLLLPLLLVLHLPYVYGLATLGQALGRRLHAAVPERATAIGVLIVLLPLALLGVVAPIWSLVLLYLVAGAGLGAVILSRGGTLAVG